MNRYIEAVKAVDLDAVRTMLQSNPKWLHWSEPTGKNALHYLCGLDLSGDRIKTATSLEILKLLLKNGMDIDSVHRIEEKNCDFFPATPLWYAYTRGRNETLYKYLLKQGADPNNCMWAMAWYDDVEAAELFIKLGAKVDEKPSISDLFVGAYAWKKLTFAKWALDKGADVNTIGPDANTALMLAVKRKDEGAVKLLLSFGADADLQNEKAMSARKIAEAKGPKRILNLL